MTCIVGLIDKEQNKVYIGGDSAGMNTSTYNLQIRKDPKVFINDKFLIGFTTSFRMGQLLMFNKLVDREQHVHESDYEYIIQEFIPTIKKLFKDEGFSNIKENQEKGGTFLLGYNKKLYYIEDNFQVAELFDNYVACGCGAEYALGSLYSTQDYKTLSSEDRIYIALEATEHHNAGVKSPFKILSI